MKSLGMLTLLAFAQGLAAAACAAERSGAVEYVKRDTWQETILLARQSLTRSEEAKGKVGAFRSYISPVVHGGEPARRLSIPVAGVQDLYLFVTGVPNPVGGAATWAEGRLIAADGTSKPLSHFPGLAVLEGRHAVDVNLKSGVSGRLAIGGRQFDRGLHVYANSKVRVPLAGRYENFEAWIGIDDWVAGRGHVRFHVTDSAGAARLDLWERVFRDFPEERPRREMRWEREDRIWDEDWRPGDYAAMAARYAAAASRVPPLAFQAAERVAATRNATDVAKVRALYHESRALDEALSWSRHLDFRAARTAMSDLCQCYGDRYVQGPTYLARLDGLEKAVREAVAAITAKADLAAWQQVARLVADFDRLRREALLANPLVDFDRLLVIRRQPNCDPRWPVDTGYGMGEYLGLPRQSSKCNPGIEEPLNWDNEIAVLQPVRPEGKLTTLYQSDRRRVFSDLDLHWDADRLLFSMPGTFDKWQVFEIGADGRGLRQLTPGDQPDVHSYDACYLPNGRIAFISTAPLQGVPCNAGVIVGMMYQMDGDGRNIQQVCFEQDHDYCPTVLNDGRVLYLRWDYTDTPHVWNRVLFSMNPDGTDQAEYYGSNSYWPNAIFYARPVPNHPTKVAGIVTGHHVGRVGELVIFDSAKGRREADGVVQRIPGYGRKVEPVIEDKLTEHSWPKFLHPWPLSDKYFLVSCKPTPESLWGIYLVDVFDNMVLVKEIEGQALLQPIPLKKRPRPPVIPDQTRPGTKDATVYMADVYSGPGLAGIPRGTVKSLRVFSYHFGYQQVAGIDHRVGTDGPWEVKRILGTVPVEADGSALFRIPAKTPISVQPLDAEGKAVQLMRSWMTAMPGETLSCVGCHDRRNTSPRTAATIAQSRGARQITPWYGPARNFSFRREVQPVLDEYCVGCHGADGKTPPDLRADQGRYLCYRGGDPRLHVERGPREKLVGRYGGIFEPSYLALRSLVRVAGLESDLRLLPPTEFHADTSELVQMLKRGHYGVNLDAEAWDRLVTWIDLNAPEHGAWGEFVRIKGKQQQRRCELRKLYGGPEEDYEEMPAGAVQSGDDQSAGTAPTGHSRATAVQSGDESPHSKAPAVQSGDDHSAPTVPVPHSGIVARTLDLGDKVTLELVRIPAGSFIMGQTDGEVDERPAAAVKIAKSFWMARCEITNEQFARFDPKHESRYEHRGSWIFGEEYLGWPLDRPKQPVVRVSWHEAMAFCRWLSQRSGLHVTLPTEAQWEYACRAGTATPFSYGSLETDFSPFANLADSTIRDLAYKSWSPRTPDIVPRDERFNDGMLVTAATGSCRANAWGLFDLHGNAAEWTRTAYREYPYREDDGRNALNAKGAKVVRGGSWRDRPARCRSAARQNYLPHQKVFNVGFRVVGEESEGHATATRTSPPP